MAFTTVSNGRATASTVEPAMRDASEAAERSPRKDDRATFADERTAAPVDSAALAAALLTLRRERELRPVTGVRFELVPALPRFV
jgi:hypothetical protein